MKRIWLFQPVPRESSRALEPRSLPCPDRGSSRDQSFQKYCNGEATESPFSILVLLGQIGKWFGYPCLYWCPVAAVTNTTKLEFKAMQVCHLAVLQVRGQTQVSLDWFMCVGRAVVLSGGSRGESTPCPLPASRDARALHLWSPPPSSNPASVPLPRLPLAMAEQGSLPLGTHGLWGHLDSPACSPLSRSPTLARLSSPLCHGRSHVPRFWGLGRAHLWVGAGGILLATTLSCQAFEEVNSIATTPANQTWLKHLL